MTAVLRWVARLLFIRLLGRRALPLLALLGLVGAWRGRRTKEVASVDLA